MEQSGEKEHRVVQDSAFHNLPDHILFKIFHKEKWSIDKIMLTCRRFHEIITQNRKLNKNFIFKVRSRAFREWTPVQEVNNLLAILKTKRKFEEGDFLGIRTDESWQVVAAILQVIGQNFVYIDFTKCRVSEDLLAEILRLTPSVVKIVLSSPRIFTNDVADNFEPPTLEHLRELTLFSFEEYHHTRLFAKAKNLKKITTDEDILQNFVENVSLSSLKELDLRASRPEEHPDRYRNVIPVSLVCRLQKLEIKEKIELINLASFLATQDLNELKLECTSTDYDTMKIIFGMKNLKKLSISLHHSEKIDARIFELENRSLESLNVDTPGYDEWNTTNTVFFIHSFPNLKSLKIGAHCCHLMMPERFDFKTLKNLKDIELDLRRVWNLRNEQPQITRLTIIAENTDASFWGQFIRRTPNVKHLEVVAAKNMVAVMQEASTGWRNLEVFKTPCTYPVPPPYKREALDAILRNSHNLKELVFMSLEGFKEEYIDLLEEFDYKLSNLNYHIFYNNRLYEQYQLRLAEVPENDTEEED